MNITTYHSPTAWPNKRWLAHLQLDTTCHMDFFAATEAEARQKAETFYETEKARWARMVQPEAENRTSFKPEPAVLTSEANGRGKPGSVWVVNPITRQKARIDPSQLSTYEANGFVRGGPKTKFVVD